MHRGGQMTKLLNDAEVASILSISLSWVRKQRMFRRQGLAHEFTIDPIMIGSSPRYRENDLTLWIVQQAKKRVKKPPASLRQSKLIAKGAQKS
jgi:hypothetical protein